MDFLPIKARRFKKAMTLKFYEKKWHILFFFSFSRNFSVNYLLMHSVVSFPDFHMQTHCSGQSVFDTVFWIIKDEVSSNISIQGWSDLRPIFKTFGSQRIFSSWWENLRWSQNGEILLSLTIDRCKEHLAWKITKTLNLFF